MKQMIYTAQDEGLQVNPPSPSHVFVPPKIQQSDSRVRLGGFGSRLNTLPSKHKFTKSTEKTEFSETKTSKESHDCTTQ